MTAERKITFHIVDVFAEEPLAGNPLTVVPDADPLPESAMKRIAREFNQSETTFILQPTRPGAAFRLRSFTPAGFEVHGAGHNALGAWWWLAESGRIGPLGQGVRAAQELGDAVLDVEVQAADGALAMIGLTQGRPMAQAVHPDTAAVARALGIGPNHLVADPLPQVVSTGVSHLLVQAVGRAAVNRAQPDSGALRRELASVAAQGCYLFHAGSESPDAHAYARFFNPSVGIWEDPATGSAAGPLAWLLARRGHVPWQTHVVIEQGHQVGRPSRLVAHVAPDRVHLLGRCMTVGSGTLHY